MNHQLFLIFFSMTTVLTIEVSEYQQQPTHQEAKKPIIPIIKQSFSQHKDGFQYSYETGNGIHAEQSGYFKNKGDEKNEILVQQGTITYHDEHGHPITLTYIADEHGFQPQGAHLPTPPPIPEGIQKALQYQQEEYENSEDEEYE